MLHSHSPSHLLQISQGGVNGWLGGLDGGTGRAQALCTGGGMVGSSVSLGVSEPFSPAEMDILERARRRKPGKKGRLSDAVMPGCLVVAGDSLMRLGRCRPGESI